MKQLSRLILGVVMAMGAAITGNAWATPVTFTPDLVNSSVDVVDNAMWGDLTGSLVLSPESFTLGDGQTQTLDFFVLTASGFAINKNYTIEATLAFLDPQIAGTGSGGGKFSTIFGLISGGKLFWDPSTLPDTFLLSDGNLLSIDFEDGCTFGCGNSVTVHAFVTNNGGGTTPVPEPGTIGLLGVGLLGVGISARRRTRK